MLEPIKEFEKEFGPARYLLAPMSGITDTVFRLLMREMGAQIVISDLISAEGLIRQGKKTLDLIHHSPEERPVGLQLFGHKADSLVEAAKIVEQRGVDFIDLNLGCPVKKVVQKGGGSAWLKDPARLADLLQRVKKAISLPLTIKVRTGWDDKSINIQEVVQVAYDSGISWVAIHGRTRAQAYSGKADWELIREVAQQSPVPIVGNGDVVTGEDAQSKIDQGYAHAIMIGRGALKNPWIFREVLGQAVKKKNFVALIDKHFDLALARKEGHRAFFSVKKFLGWYAAGLPNASHFRRSLFETKDIDALRKMARDYFGAIESWGRAELGEPFLMGGHG